MSVPVTGPGTGPAQPPTGQSPTGQSVRSSARTWWIVGGCCALVVILVLLTGIGGGMWVLMSRDRDQPAPQPALATAKQDAFTFTYPEAWDSISHEPVDPQSGQLVLLSTPNGPDAIAVYQFQTENTAVNECRVQAPLLGLRFDESEDARELAPTTLGGRETFHHEGRGTLDGADVVVEEWCVEVGSEVLQLVGTSYGSHERSADVQTVLDSWRWTDGG